MIRASYGLAVVVAGLAFSGCKQREYNPAPVNNDAGEVMAASTIGDCTKEAKAINDKYALVGVNDTSKKCVPIHQFRVVRSLIGDKEVGTLATDAEGYNKFVKFLGAANFASLENGVDPALVPILANVGHGNKPGDTNHFWLAQLDLRAIESSHFQVEQFEIKIPPDALKDPETAAKVMQAKGMMQQEMAKATDPDLKRDLQKSYDLLNNEGRYFAAHGQIRLIFKNPIPLFGQNSTNKGETAKTKSIILSVHGLSDDGGYDPALGMKGAYALGLGAYSEEEKFNNSMVFKVPPNEFRQYKMNLTTEQIAKYITAYSANAQKIFRTRSYNTLDANCGSVQFEMFEEAFLKAKFGAKIPEMLEKKEGMKLGRAFPKYAQYTLRPYEMLFDPKALVGIPWTNLNQK